MLRQKRKEVREREVLEYAVLPLSILDSLNEDDCRTTQAELSESFSPDHTRSNSLASLLMIVFL